jgi:hypothetical protein
VAEQLRLAVEEAVTPEHLTAVMRRVLRMSLEGNLSAIRVLLERTCGRPAQAPTAGTTVNIDLPRLHTVAECTLAIDRLADGVCQGAIDHDAAKILLEVVQTRLKAIEVNDLETRLIELEKSATVVEFDGRTRRG